MRITDDFSLLLEYFSMLFAARKLQEVEIHGYHIKYSGMILQDGKEESFTENFPLKEELDKVKSLHILVNGKVPEEWVDVEISWDHVTGDFTDIKEFRKFLDLLDSSTFRYF
ncbi:MAG: hypothetical protein ACP5NK_07640 [Thermoplasmata archaeon]